MAHAYISSIAKKKSTSNDHRSSSKPCIQCYREIKGSSIAPASDKLIFEDTFYADPKPLSPKKQRRREMRFSPAKQYVEKLFDLESRQEVVKVHDDIFPDLPDMLLSDQGNLALEAAEFPQSFYASDKLIEVSNSDLKSKGAKVKLQALPESRLSMDSVPHSLVAVIPELLHDGDRHAFDVSGCIEFSLKLANLKAEEAFVYVLKSVASGEDLEVPYNRDSDVFVKECYQGLRCYHETGQEDDFLEGRKRPVRTPEELKKGITSIEKTTFSQHCKAFGLNEHLKPQTADILRCESIDWEEPFIRPDEEHKGWGYLRKLDQEATEAQKKGDDYVDRYRKELKWTKHGSFVIAVDGGDYLCLENYNWRPPVLLNLWDAFDTLLLRCKTFRNHLMECFSEMNDAFFHQSLEDLFHYMSKWVKDIDQYEHLQGDARIELQQMYERYLEMANTPSSKQYFLRMYGAQQDQSFHEVVSPQVAKGNLSFIKRKDETRHIEYLKKRAKELFQEFHDMACDVSFSEASMQSYFQDQNIKAAKRFVQSLSVLDSSSSKSDIERTVDSFSQQLHSHFNDLLASLYRMVLDEFALSTSGIDQMSCSDIMLDYYTLLNRFKEDGLEDDFQYLRNIGRGFREISDRDANI
ncbi:hypothetical protein [Aureibacter tunicatorum]|uniref:Uncharacterized protein n=1 Tax=Aureibacter tunicatorum TaxID=866807 RepID=A0AAE3XS48_9BACT|nr:hypothetical protein [Aureibacter tunicatorum]MDR6240469.1 hypothetical protein [Aureibacter tunicatorum]BDD05652.1 hypothetical protein AUTU_31350 [Aureibacter tunicatorum]